MPRYVHLVRLLGEHIRTELLHVRTDGAVEEVFRVCPVEQVNVERQRNWRILPGFVGAGVWTEFQFLVEELSYW